MIRPKIFILFLIQSAICNLFIPLGQFVIHSQPVQQQWVAWYDNPDHQSDVSTAMVVDTSGNVYVTGYSYFTNNSQSYFATVKYNASGVQQWVKTFYELSSQANQPTGISMDLSGYIYVMGFSGNILSGVQHTVIIKYNSNGDSLWVRKYYGDGTNNNSPNSIANDRQGNIYLTGGGDYHNLFLIKYNSNGDTLWSRLYNRPGYDGSYGTSMAIDTSGNIYIGGDCWESIPPPNRPDFLVVKYTPSGNLLWSAVDSLRLTLEGIYRIALDRQANVIATGYAADNNGNNSNFMTVKWNNNGVFQWERRYFQGNGDWAYDIVTDSFGNIYITGESYSTIPPVYIDYSTIKYNIMGDSLWVRRYGKHGGAAVSNNRIAIDLLSNIYILGVYKDSSNNYFLSTIKYNTNGVQQWLVNKPANISSSSNYNIFVDNYFNVYSCSSASQSGNNFDYITIKYSQPSGIIINNDFVNKFELAKNYPNPFNPNTNIMYEIGSRSLVKLSIYDILGRKVYEFPEQIKEAGYYTSFWDGSIFSSGVYFCKLIANYKENSNVKEFSETIKMLLVK